MNSPWKVHNKKRSKTAGGWAGFLYGALVAAVFGLIAGSWLAWWTY